jgi:hypothetical protein
MATPRSESYSAPSGAEVYAGRQRAFPLAARIQILGQSNSEGRGPIADISAAPLSSDPGLATLAAGTFSRVKVWNGAAYVSLQMGVNNGQQGASVANGTQFGPEFGLAVRWVRETTSGTLYIEKVGGSGLSITDFDPTPTYDSYQLQLGERTQANTWLASNGGIVIEQEAMLWVQGETDYQQTQNWYQTQMQAIVDAQVSDGMLAPTSKQILVQMHPSTNFYGAGVAAAKAAIAASDPNRIKAPTAPYYMLPDNYHQNAQGQVQMGYDAFALIFGVHNLST